MQHESPPDPPRPFDWDRFTNTWPVNLKIAFVVVPVVSAASLVWFLLSTSRESTVTLIVCGLVIPVYAGMIVRRLHFYRHADAFECEIVGIDKSSDPAFASSRLVEYEYAVDGKVYTDSHLIEDARNWSVGDKAYVLAFRDNPHGSVLWVGKTRRRK